MESNEKKSKNFGYTFFVILSFVNIYLYYNYEWYNFFLILITLVFLFLTITKPKLLIFPSLYWEKFGLFLGRFFSPIILSIVYLFTILPINLILRIFSIDLINIKTNNSNKTYWTDRQKRKTNFRNQF